MPTPLNPANPAPWTEADEAAFVAASAQAPPVPESPWLTLGRRYTAVRDKLEKAAPLTTTEYLLGQMVLLNIDMYQEIAGLRDDLQTLINLNMELVVHRVPADAGRKK